MIANEYDRLYRAEEGLWWFRAMHLFLLRLLPKEHHSRFGLRALDIGCGTGGFIKKLTRAGYRAVGLDYSRIALDYARRRSNDGLVQASANHLPFEAVFDFVVSIDLLEVGSVEPDHLVLGALRALKPGGYGIFVMAAHQRLLSEHDRAVNSVRRYNLKQMQNLFVNHNVKVLRASYLFLFLFPLVALRKLLNPERKYTTNKKRTSDVRVPPAFINVPLYALCWVEAQFLSVFNLPMGSSVLVLVRKNV